MPVVETNRGCELAWTRASIFRKEFFMNTLKAYARPTRMLLAVLLLLAAAHAAADDLSDQVRDLKTQADWNEMLLTSGGGATQADVRRSLADCRRWFASRPDQRRECYKSVAKVAKEFGL